MKNMYNKKTLEPLIVSFGLYYKNISWFIENNQLDIPGHQHFECFSTNDIYINNVLHNEIFHIIRRKWQS